MAFSGFDKDDNPLFDSQESAIEYARMKINCGIIDKDTKIMLQRQHIPLWLAELVRETPFEFLAYTEVK